MSSPAATSDPYTDPMKFGQRLQILRERRGMTRVQLAGLVGTTPHTVKKIENGRQQAPGLEMVMRFAEALRVRNLSDLTGLCDMHVDLFVGPGHPRLAAVKAAVDEFPLPTDRQAPPAEHLKARLHAAWKARHQAENHREVVGRLLPDLIRDAQALVRQADSAPDRRAAQALLSETYTLSQFFVARAVRIPRLMATALAHGWTDPAEVDPAVGRAPSPSATARIGAASRPRPASSPRTGEAAGSGGRGGGKGGGRGSSRRPSK